MMSTKIAISRIYQVCPACGMKVDYLTTLHMRSHGCKSKSEFIKKFGEIEQVQVYMDKDYRILGVDKRPSKKFLF